MHNTTTKTPTTIDYRQITLDPSFRYRSGPDSPTHLEALRKTLRNTGRLDAILVWQEVKDDGNTTGRLVLLDGHYRYGAYRAEQADGKISGKGIPAVLLKCDRMEALLAGLKANAKDVVPLTAIERMDAAWRLVQTFRLRLSKRRLSEAAGVSERTIARMRQQLRKFIEEKETPSGSWMSDRRFPEKNDYTPPTDEARREMTETLAKALKEALNEVRTRDVEIIGDALHRTLGARQFATIVDYLNGDDEDGDGTTGWMQPDEFEAGLPEGNLRDPFSANTEETAEAH